MASKKKTSVKPAEQGGAVANYDYGEEHKGGGYEGTSGADYAIPFLAILQSNSPQVDGSKGPEVKIAEAEAGMLMNTVSMKLYDGAKKGVVFIPCITNRTYVEWKKRSQGGGGGGGFVARHDPDSEAVRKCVSSQPFGKYEINGNDLSETFYVYGILLDEETGETEMIIIAFSSTKIKKYKHVMYRLGSYKGRPPLYANRLRIKTFGDQNDKGYFQNFIIQPAIDDDVGKSLIPPKDGDEPNPLLLAGKQLKEQVLSGVVKADHKSEAVAAGTGDATDDAY